MRKFFLKSIGLQIFINQILQFEDDLLNESDKTILRINELNSAEEVSVYIAQNIDEELSIPSLYQMAGIDSNKIQLG